MSKTYKWYLDRKYIERESEKAILVNVSIFRFWIPKKMVMKQEFSLRVSIFLFDDSTFTDLTTNQVITGPTIIEHFKQDIQESNSSKVATKANMFKQEYKQNIRNNFQQQLNNTYQQNNDDSNDFEIPNWDDNDLI